MIDNIKKAGAIIISVIILMGFLGCSQKFDSKDFDVDRAYSIIAELSSKEFNGRAAGTSDGEKTENYVAEKFKEIGLEPGGENGTYFQKFQGVRGNPKGEYVLEVLDGNRTVKKYKYGSDYKFLTYTSYDGDVTSKCVVVDDISRRQNASGQIVLIQSIVLPASNQKPQPLIDLYEAGYRGIITVREPVISRLKGQSGFVDNSVASKLPRVSVSPKVYSELLTYVDVGYKVHLKAAFEAKQYTARNVIGILKSSKPSDDYLIISAHMDHLEPDPDGVYFPGALDNASGTASIIEIARSLKNQSIKPNINIVFIAFNGEEVMLDGSRYYVKNPIYPLKNTKVINLDMVGAKSTLPISIIISGDVSRGAKEFDIVEELKKTAQSLDYKYEVSNDGSSDHYPFAIVGVPAVTIIDHEKVVYHVPGDSIDNIGIDNLKRDITLVMEVIGKEAYGSSNVGVGMWLYGSGGVLVIVFAVGIVVYYKKRKLV